MICVIRGRSPHLKIGGELIKDAIEDQDDIEERYN